MHGFYYIILWLALPRCDNGDNAMRIMAFAKFAYYDPYVLPRPDEYVNKIFDSIALVYG